MLRRRTSTSGDANGQKDGQNADDARLHRPNIVRVRTTLHDMPTRVRPEADRAVGAADGNILLDLFVVQERVGELLDAALAGTGVRAAEFAVFSQLGAGSLTPGEIGARLGTTKSTLAGHLGALERRGHLRRRPHPQDGRSHLLELTLGGRRTLEECQARFRVTLGVFESELQHPGATARVILLDVDQALARAVERLANRLAPAGASYHPGAVSLWTDPGPSSRPSDPGR